MTIAGYDGLKHRKDSARTLLQRFFSSRYDWEEILKNFDQLKDPDGRLIGWKKNELEGVLAIVSQAQIYDEIAQAKTGELFIDYYERLRRRVTEGGRKPEDFGITLRQLSAWRRKKVNAEIEEKLDSIEEYPDHEMVEYKMCSVFGYAEDLIKFLHKEKRTLAGNPRRDATWKKIEMMANRWIVESEQGKKPNRDYRAMILVEILNLHNSGYIKVIGNVQELTDRVARLCRRKVQYLKQLPNV